MKSLKMACLFTIYGIAAIILVFSVVCMLFQLKPAVVVSGSMEPAIKTGSLILIDRTDKDLKTGDIAAYRTGGVSVAHRVVDILEDGNYVTKGDANDSPDISPVGPEMIEGTVICSVPGIGYAVKWLSPVTAYLTGGDRADNVMTVGYNKISVIEEFIPPDRLEPGSVFTKKVSIENTGDNPCAVRVSAEFSDSGMASLVSLDIDDEYWEYRDDGYYYYKEILDSDDMTYMLFNSVAVSEEATAEQLKDFEIMIYAESRNAEKDEAYDEVSW